MRAVRVFEYKDNKPGDYLCTVYDVHILQLIRQFRTDKVSGVYFETV